MAILQLKPHLTVEQLKERMNKERRVYAFKRWQMLHAVATHRGITAQQIAWLLGASINVVRRTVQLYNKSGAVFMEQGTWGGRREKRCLMDFEEEQKLLHSVGKLQPYKERYWWLGNSKKQWKTK